MTEKRVDRRKFIQNITGAAAISSLPYEAFAAGIGDHKIVTTLCPGGKERMRRLMEVVRNGRVDFTPLLTHTFPLDQIGEA